MGDWRGPRFCKRILNSESLVPHYSYATDGGSPAESNSNLMC